MLDLNKPEIKFAVQTVQKASVLVKQVQAELVTPALTKNDRSPVTVGDFASQALVGYLLQKSFPEDLFIAEEDSAALKQPEEAKTLEQVTYFVKNLIPEAAPDAVCRWIDHGRADSGARFWTLDPIDGTKGFLRGDQYAIALALVQNGVVEIGVLGCPELGEAQGLPVKETGSLIIAVRGFGTWITSLQEPKEYQRLNVSTQDDPTQARVLRSFESGHTNVSQIDIFSNTLNIQAEPVRMDSQAKYASLAAGEGDLLLRLLSPSQPNYQEKIWDQTAGSIVLEEAGGRITDLDGKPLDFSTGRKLVNNRGILASNAKLHDQALTALKAIKA
jgi:3'(2'), 5'-bisphosphate nucleotidase